MKRPTLILPRDGEILKIGDYVHYRNLANRKVVATIVQIRTDDSLDLRFSTTSGNLCRNQITYGAERGEGPGTWNLPSHSLE